MLVVGDTFALPPSFTKNCDCVSVKAELLTDDHKNSLFLFLFGLVSKIYFYHHDNTPSVARPSCYGAYDDGRASNS